jgi:phage terminase Nu1 subunit (DNA packaging protein)
MKPQVPPPLPVRSAGMGEYVKRAFLYRWNMLLFLGGTAAAMLSPWPDALLPLVAAAEVAYLGGVVSIPKFRQAIDAQSHKQSRPVEAGGGASAVAARPVASILESLPEESRRRFEEVRARCLDMRTIASGVRGRTGGHQEAGHDLSTPALDRLLWVFLRLLVSRESLSSFLAKTDLDAIRLQLSETRKRVEEHRGGDERIIRSLMDAAAAQELRIQNYERAENNHEYVRVELDRIEAKIQALAESSVNRQDPDFLSSQIDSVTESMQSTERAISELQHITGLVDEMQEPPAILESDFGKVTGS